MIIRNLKFAWESIMEGKIKAMLSVLSIAISVFTMIAILSISQMLYDYVVEQFQKVGTELIWVQSETSTISGNKSLQMKDVKSISNLSFVKNVSPNYVTSGNVYANNDIGNVVISGVNEDYSLIKNMKIYGQFLNSRDCENSNNVCVISDDVRKKYLYKNINPIGEQVNISGIYYTIIGYVEPLDADMDFVSSLEQNDCVYIPYTTFQKNYNNVLLNTILLTVDDDTKVDEYKNQITALLSGLIISGVNITVDSVQDTLSQYTTIINNVNVFFIIFVVVTMIISGIGIMNVLLMSTFEKKWEIGLRKSIGAGRTDILFQFLIEIIILSMIGVIIGVFVSIQFVTAFSVYAEVIKISNQAIVLSILFCFLISLVFGTIPALRASKMLPLQCLEKE